MKKKEAAIAELIRIAKTLKNNGVDLKKISMSKTVNGKTTEILLREIKQEGIDIEKIIEENGLDGEFKYGMKVYQLRQAYKGKGGYKITEDKKRQAEELGLLKKERIVDETLEVAKILKANGVNLKKIPLTNFVNGESVFILLREIKQEGIDIQKIIKENNLDGEFKYGQRVSVLRTAYKGKGSFAITQKGKHEAEELGLLEKEKEKGKEKGTAIPETIRIARILKKNGVDLRKIQLRKYANGKTTEILLREIKQEGIDIEKIIEENGLDGEFKYGQRVRSLMQAYRGKGGCKITEEEKHEAEELGLITLLSAKEIKKQESLDKNKEAKLLLKKYEDELEKKEKIKNCSIKIK